jgi:hypothetical protein
MSATPKHPKSPDARGAHSLHRLAVLVIWKKRTKSVIRWYLACNSGINMGRKIT